MKNGAKALKNCKKSKIHVDNLVDLEKCCKMRTEYLDAKIGVDPAEKEPLKV